MPLIEIGHSCVGGKARTIAARRGPGEAQEGKAVRAQERRNLRDRELLFLHMEEKIAALADREEISVFRDVAHCRALLEPQDVLPAATDIIGALAIAALGNVGASGADVRTRERAVEAYMHKAARP